ncbi:hypothetical protein SAMN05880590_102742 [Rhizobium sp. RU35A]|uniref:hypothetical protein n=1 Tax=Rhizobium sp. RU35A TaxID=1907414 RepID=UPI000956BA60|nr:hypothetical protein [Rhizobium sp. RU35A]SIQ23945.1 hypothetical protein SAMN05880590_102742 [Rhizobium sp. RU35A]
MRLYINLRMATLGSLAFLACAVLLSVPASADLLSHDEHVTVISMTPIDIVHAIDLLDHVVIPAETRHDVARGTIPALVTIAVPRLLKPDYVESYRTAGRNFLDVRWRC